MIALITPTGNREKQIALCDKWMRRQTYQGDILWVIVDDAEPKTIEHVGINFPQNWTIKKVYPTPIWEIGQNTQCRNIRAGLEVVKHHKDVHSIYIIEDDDFYFPEYLDVMERKLRGYVATAETCTIYFNVQTVKTIFNQNTKHGSLFQTAFTPDILPVFEKCLENAPKFIDMLFWRTIQGAEINLFSTVSPLSIGIKGMQGRPGIGSGHIQRYITIPKGEDRIEKIKSLKTLIGMDYLLYL